MKNSFTITLNPEQQDRLEIVLRDGNYRPLEAPHARMAAETGDCRVTLYAKSGKCLVQGRGAEDFVQFVLEPLVIGEARLGYEAVHDPGAAEPHIGVDESGKGDYFGPMVIAAAYIDGELHEAMRALDVRDSKRFSADKRLMDVAAELRRLLGRRFAVVSIGPAAYNRLYTRMRSVNAILAWGHARALENLLEIVPDCPRAISDQFGDARQVKRALMSKGRTIELEQRPRAETDPAVAAASILARAAFLDALKRMGNLHGARLPKGASASVRDAAAELVATHGPDILLQTAKAHFRTTDDVLAPAGRTRADLGPDGQARSRPASRWRKPRTGGG